MPKKWLLLSILVLVCVLAAVIVPRLQRVAVYQRKITEPTVALKLAIKLWISHPILPFDSVSVDTLYSTFQVPANVFTSMEPHETWLLLHGPSSTEVILSEVGYLTELSPDCNFTFYQNAINAEPSTQWEAFAMSDTDFTTHLSLIIGKAATPYADSEVLYFETLTVKGFIRHGSESHYSDTVNIAIWDKKYPLSQEVTIKISDPVLRQQVTDSIAASYRFKLDEAPSPDALKSIAKQAAELFSPSQG